MPQPTKSSITFCGGVGATTGANFLLTLPQKDGGAAPLQILIDCGLLQGEKFAEDFNREHFPYTPASIDVLVITHSHIDHIGRIPKLVKDGFRGRIISTPPTRELAMLMLDDTVNLLDAQARREGVMPIYGRQDVSHCFEYWDTLEYHTPKSIGKNTATTTLTLKDAGHILGSAMADFSIMGTDGKEKHVVFTGDLGNSPSLFLCDTETVADASYMVMESVYGDRNHESKDERKRKLTDIIKDTIARKRTLIIPAFSLERTQDILFELNDMVEKGIVEPVPVFIDSPLAIKVTDVYKHNSQYFKPEAQARMKSGDDLFRFPKLRFTATLPESLEIVREHNPKIIIAGSGMSNGGRVAMHERTYLPKEDTTLLLIGYQAIGTLGRKLMDGAKTVTIKGEEVPVRAEVKGIFGYSSHKDSEHLLEFVSDSAESKTLKKVFVCMGEPKSSLFLAQRIKDYLGITAICPELNQKIDLDL